MLHAGMVKRDLYVFSAALSADDTSYIRVRCAMIVVCVATVPQPPRSLTVMPGNGAFMITLEPPLDDGGDPLLEYVIEFEYVVNRVNTTIFETGLFTSGDLSLPIYIGNVSDNSTELRLRARAANSVGVSNLSTTAVNITTCAFCERREMFREVNVRECS